MIISSVSILAPLALADTNGTELKITAQPDRLVLELGADWAGAEFELRLDAGVFPVPVVVNESGVLSMDLGGSKTYTLALKSHPGMVVDHQHPNAGQGQPPDMPPETSNHCEEQQAAEDAPSVHATGGGIPPLHLVLFIGGSLAAIGGLVVMKVLKKRRESYEYDDYDYDEDE